MMLLLLFAAVTLGVVSSEDYLEVNINQGPVRGYRTSEGIFAFYGIPYATAPTGRHKFKAPLAPPTWETPFEATERFIACPQSGQSGLTDFIREDCLIANIFVPDTQETNLSVVVYIHGGAYQFGYGESMSPKQLVKSRKIIAVNFNYRLGPNGFLCLGTEDAPGNAAMKDQVALLRWVQKNIAYFGGNPRDVTISGCSAGGSSVDLHLVSKISKGLFNKAIPESSANVAAYSVQPDPIEYAQMYAKSLNFDNVDDLEALEEFYKTAPFSLLNSVNVMERRDSSVVFTPCVERDIGQEMFLESDPVSIIKSGAYQKLPMLYGFTDMEGLLRLPFFYFWKNFMNENFSDFLPENLQFTSVEEKAKVAQEVKQFYFGNETVNENTISKFIDYFSDITFVYGMLQSVELQVEAGNKDIFLYEYTYFDESNTLPFNLRGATHCAQATAVLDEGNEDELSEEYQKVKSYMRDLWLNFITTGTPVPEGSGYPQWLPAGKNRSPHMSLDSSMELKGELEPERAQFWDGIYEKYYRTPVPPTK